MAMEKVYPEESRTSRRSHQPFNFAAATEKVTEPTQFCIVHVIKVFSNATA
jgi:hypothetical protein